MWEGGQEEDRRQGCWGHPTLILRMDYLSPLETVLRRSMHFVLLTWKRDSIAYNIVASEIMVS